MNSRKLRMVMLFVSFICFLLTGCRMARMRIRPELLAATEVMWAEGRWSIGFTKPFSFGSYQVTDIKGDWTKSSGFSIELQNTKKLSIREKGRGRVYTLDRMGSVTPNVVHFVFSRLRIIEKIIHSQHGKSAAQKYGASHYC
ncbi:MAG: hypothetical protein HWN68_18655 [Desulfobacterales bacterium]|nr:hypothetical protein [Desulfobacterales bacterium]